MPSSLEILWSVPLGSVENKKGVCAEGSRRYWEGCRLFSRIRVCHHPGICHLDIQEKTAEAVIFYTDLTFFLSSLLVLMLEPVELDMRNVGWATYCVCTWVGVCVHVCWHSCCLLFVQLLFLQPVHCGLVLLLSVRRSERKSPQSCFLLMSFRSWLRRIFAIYESRGKKNVMCY